MELKIGTLLTLEPAYSDRIEKFRCRVVDRQNNTIFIDYPINVATKKTAFLVEGAQFQVTFNTNTKESYCFNSEVLGRRAGNIQTILLSCPPYDEFIKIQRREYVRVDTPVDVAIEHDGRFYQFVAEDISAGGLAIGIESPVAFKDDDIVKLVIVLPFTNGNMRYVETEALVVRVYEKDDRTIASIRFTDTDEIDQQHIIRFCFERQLMIRKREMNEL